MIKATWIVAKMSWVSRPGAGESLGDAVRPWSCADLKKIGCLEVVNWWYGAVFVTILWKSNLYWCIYVCVHNEFPVYLRERLVWLIAVADSCHKSSFSYPRLTLEHGSLYCTKNCTHHLLTGLDFHLSKAPTYDKGNTTSPQINNTY